MVQLPKGLFQYVKLGGRGEKLAGWQDGVRSVHDAQTDLYWEVKSSREEDFNFSGRKLSWTQFHNDYLRELNACRYGGFDDWRAPLKAEIRTLVDYRRIAPAVAADALHFLTAKEYWCGASAYGLRPDCGWTINFNLGAVTAKNKSLASHCLAVRGECRLGRRDRFHDNGDGTITDAVTGLMWQQAQPERMSYRAVSEMLEDYELAGHKDWRLPDMVELGTIFDESYENRSWYFDGIFTCDELEAPILQHITSDTFEDSYVWVTNFNFGYDGYYAEFDMPLCYRLVREIRGKTAVFQLPESGQREVYAPDGTVTGESSEVRNAPFCFWREASGIIHDENTGICYAGATSDTVPGLDKDRLFSYAQARRYVTELNESGHGGYADWRLPSCDELRLIADYGGAQPAVAPCFPERLAANFYWTGDVHPFNKSAAWAIYFGYGCAVPVKQSQRYGVLAARGGHRTLCDQSPARYVVEEETVTDLYTGKMWLRAELPLLTVREAEEYLQARDLAGFRDWRLPELKELSTLVRRDCRNESWFDTVLFPDVNKAGGMFFLAAETFNGMFNWGVNIKQGYDGYYADRLNGKYRIKPVRNVQTN